MAQTSFVLVMLGIAAVVALLLGVVGIYGVISYVATQRTREIGIRIALGAAARDVTGLFLRQGLLLAVIGIALVVAAAAGLTRVMSALLFGVSADGPADVRRRLRGSRRRPSDRELHPGCACGARRPGDCPEVGGVNERAAPVE